MPSMPSKGPISLQGRSGLWKADVTQVTQTLRIKSTTRSCSGPAEAHSSTLAAWLPLGAPPTEYVYAVLARGSDCVVTIRANDRVPTGCLLMDAALRSSLHLCPDDTHDFRLFSLEEGERIDLVSLEAEVRVMTAEPGVPVVIEADEAALEETLLRTLQGHIVAVGQVIVLPWTGCTVVARITAADTLNAAAQQETVSYHCFRGLVSQRTAIGATAPPVAASSAPLPRIASLGLDSNVDSKDTCDSSGSENEINPTSAPARKRRLILTNRRHRPPLRPSPLIVDIHTNDGEVFPVRRQLLRPCIALTGAVRADSDSPPSIAVDIGTLVFDRVLIFLEAVAAGQPLPIYGIHLVEDLLAAAEKLQLRSLQEVCASKLGQSESRLRQYAFEEVVSANKSGSCWLIIDGMVLDVGGWLSEHPGGSTIIPSQALNMDVSRMFEVYHASRESFLYLKEFYIGELIAEERAASNKGEEPSPEFMHQLREFTTWRISAEAKTFLSL